MSPEDDDSTDGPARETAYSGPGYPTIGARRSHMRRLAVLAGGAAALGAGWSVTRPEVATCTKGAPPPPDAGSWLGNETPEEPPPRLMGEIAVALPEDPGEGDPFPTVEPPESYPEIAGDLAVPLPPEPEPPRVRGRIAMPTPPVPPRDTDGSAVIEATGAATGSRYRDVYLAGSTRSGEPFTLLLRLDEGDGDSYEAVLAVRRRILAALAPLADDPTLATGRKALRTVKGLVPGAAVRDAGVLR